MEFHFLLLLSIYKCSEYIRWNPKNKSQEPKEFYSNGIASLSLNPGHKYNFKNCVEEIKDYKAMLERIDFSCHYHEVFINGDFLILEKCQRNEYDCWQKIIYSGFSEQFILLDTRNVYTDYIDEKYDIENIIFTWENDPHIFKFCGCENSGFFSPRRNNSSRFPLRNGYNKSMTEFPQSQNNNFESQSYLKKKVHGIMRLHHMDNNSFLNKSYRNLDHEDSTHRVRCISCEGLRKGVYKFTKITLLMNFNDGVKLIDNKLKKAKSIIKSAFYQIKDVMNFFQNQPSDGWKNLSSKQAYGLFGESISHNECMVYKGENECAEFEFFRHKNDHQLIIAIHQSAKVNKLSFEAGEIVIMKNVIIEEKVKIMKGAYIGEGSHIKKNTTIGNNSFLEGDVTIGPNVYMKSKNIILKRAYIGSECEISNMSSHDDLMKIRINIGYSNLIDSEVKIKNGSFIFSRNIIGYRSVIERNVKIISENYINDRCLIGENAVLGFQNLIFFNFHITPNIIIPFHYVALAHISDIKKSIIYYGDESVFEVDIVFGTSTSYFPLYPERKNNSEIKSIANTVQQNFSLQDFKLSYRQS